MKKEHLKSNREGKKETHRRQTICSVYPHLITFKPVFFFFAKLSKRMSNVKLLRRNYEDVTACSLWRLTRVLEKSAAFIF
jgi:hypothetical protein